MLAFGYVFRVRQKHLLFSSYVLSKKNQSSNKTDLALFLGVTNRINGALVPHKR